MDPWHDYETALWCFFNEVNLLHDHEIDLLFYVKHIIEEFLKYSGMILIFFWANHLWKGNGKNGYILHMSPSCLVLCWKRSSSPLRHDQGEIILIHKYSSALNKYGGTLIHFEKNTTNIQISQNRKGQTLWLGCSKFFFEFESGACCKKGHIFLEHPNKPYGPSCFVRASTNLIKIPLRYIFQLWKWKLLPTNTFSLSNTFIWRNLASKDG